jgi:hypothetical protein
MYLAWYFFSLRFWRHLQKKDAQFALKKGYPNWTHNQLRLVHACLYSHKAHSLASIKALGFYLMQKLFQVTFKFSPRFLLVLSQVGNWVQNELTLTVTFTPLSVAFWIISTVHQKNTPLSITSCNHLCFVNITQPHHHNLFIYTVLRLGRNILTALKIMSWHCDKIWNHQQSLGVFFCFWFFQVCVQVHRAWNIFNQKTICKKLGRHHQKSKSPKKGMQV